MEHSTGNTLELTQFQLTNLSNLISTRQRAQADESEFVLLCIKAAGMEVGKDVQIKLENGRLTW